VDLSEKENITNKQWSVLESKLFSIQEPLLARLKAAERKYMTVSNFVSSFYNMNIVLGEIELELSKAIIFFDTYLDILSQRRLPLLGRMLGGCDVIARDALNKYHPALAIMEFPIVFCDRGFGASIIREGITFPGNIINPIPLLQIPYSRLGAKYDLTSIIHEAGHEAMMRLGLNHSLPKVIRAGLYHAGAPSNICSLFALWMSEIGPDFWGFCNSGSAQTSSVKEIFSLPPDHVFQISWGDPHPPVYIRILLSIDWCRQQWGRGEWDYWEKEWERLYPIKNTSKENAKILDTCRSYIAIVTKILFRSRFTTLGGKTIPDLFDMLSIAPWRISSIANTLKLGRLNLKGLNPCIQLAVFRYIRDNMNFSEDFIDRIMTEWLVKLADTRLMLEVGPSRNRNQYSEVAR
jgi:hypothetical protein